MPDKKNPSYVLFMCDANTVRSAIAHALLKEFFRHEIYVDSAGVNPNDVPNGFVYSVMNEIQIDCSSHRAKSFEQLEDSSFDLIIALSQKAYEKAKKFAKTHHVEVEFWDIPDITQTQGSRDYILEEYRKVRNLIYRKIFQRFHIDKNKISDKKNWNILNPS